MTFDSYIQGTKPVLVDFFATWCGPCMHMAPVLKRLKDELGDRVTVLKMDIDKNPGYTERYAIQAVPTIIIFKQGKIVWRKSGVANLQELRHHVTMHLSN